MRTFIAIELSDAVIDLMKSVQNHLKSRKLAFKWVRPSNIHLTLRFLGDVAGKDVPGICHAMTAAAKETAPFSLFTKGMGAFPGLSRPRVLWMGLDGDVPQLQQLHAGLEENLAVCGFEKEIRSYKGHLTLGRANGRPDPVRVIDCVGEIRGFSAEAFTVKEITLFHSRLNRRVRYTRNCSVQD